jgi:hypothetical protein
MARDGDKERIERLRLRNQRLRRELEEARLLLATLAESMRSAPSRFPGEMRFRRRRLAELLESRGGIPFKLACAALGVSRATAYRVARRRAES